TARLGRAGLGALRTVLAHRTARLRHRPGRRFDGAGAGFGARRRGRRRGRLAAGFFGPEIAAERLLDGREGRLA
ncbi:MAG: hypothetical protein ACWA6X_11800, partial [Bauldia sp.]